MNDDDLGLIPDDDDDLGLVPEQSFMSKVGHGALDSIHTVGKFVDSYGGDASARAGIYAAQDGQNPLMAGISQYGDSDTAPTGKMIAERAGVPDEPLPEPVRMAGNFMKDGTLAGQAYQHFMPQGIQDSISNMSQSDLAGFGVDLAASPLNVASPVIKVLKKLSPVAQKISQMVSNRVPKLGETFTGVPAEVTKRYQKDGPEILQRYREAGGSLPAAADEVRKGVQDAIGNFKNKQNKNIEGAQRLASTEKDIDASSAINILEDHKLRLNKDLQDTSIEQIDEVIQKIKKATRDGNTNISEADLIAAVDVLQNIARKGRAYKDGEIFKDATKAASAAQSAAADLRNIRNDKLPGVADPFRQLENLHRIEDNINPNLIKPDTPDGALFAAGSRENARNYEKINSLGELVDYDFKGKASELPVMRHFADPKFLPTDPTGKSVARMALAGLGTAAATIMGLNPVVATIISGAITSPAALKLAIDTGRIPANILKAITGHVSDFSKAEIDAIYATLKAFEVENSRNRMMEHIKKKKSQ